MTQKTHPVAVPDTTWTFPYDSVAAAIALAVIGAGLFFFWMVLVGMSHFNGSKHAAFGYAAAAFLAGASALFIRTGVRLWRGPASARRHWLRFGAITSHVLGVAAGLVAIWEVLSLALYDSI